MRKIKKLSILLLTIVCFFTAVMIGYGAKSEDDSSQEESASSAESGTLIIEDESLKICYDKETKALHVTDHSGYTWESVVTEELYSPDKLNENWKRNTKSIFHMSYAEISNVNPNTKTAYSYDADIIATKEDDRILLDCEFSEAGISLRVVIGVEDGEMVVSVPFDHISETKDYKLLSIGMLPYFGACTDTEDGYMVYPDGSGALKYHSSVKSATVTNHSYKWDVYGDDFLSIDTLQENEDEGLMTAMLPVYGIKKGEHAYIVYSEEGEEESTITMYPSGVGIALNRMSFSFRYRTTYNILMSNININGANTAQNINGTMYDEKIIALDHELRYSFLDGEEADYSGMAGRYRERLLVSGTLQKSELEESLGVSVQILMAASAEGFFNQSLSVATTAEQVNDIIEMIAETGFSDNAIYILKGWNKGGYGVYPQTAKPDGKIASVSELKELLNSGQLISLQTELFYAEEGDGSFNKRSDVIKTGNQNVISDSQGEVFLFNAENILKNLKTIAKTYSSVRTLNLSFDTIGKVLYRDKNEEQEANRAEMRDSLETVLKEAAEIGIVSIEGANLYTLKYADTIYDLPSKSSKYFVSDLDIPFCQMVLYGSIPYTGNIGNLSSDYDKQLLKWLEYGYVPVFELTYSDSNVLKETNCNDLFSSQYESNVKRLKQAYELYEDCISKVQGAYMVKHKVIEDDLVKIEYSNGYTLFINYAQQNKKCGDVTIPAEGYVMVGD